MTLEVRPYREEDAQAWDAFCEHAHQATFLHTRRFLSYHGERFIDRSLILEEDGRWVGVFPAADHPEDPRCVVSHPGITYGGLVHAGALRGEKVIIALQTIRSFFGSLGYSRLVYKAVPIIYHRVPAQDDLYALFRLDAARTRCDLSATIDLSVRLRPSERRRRGLKKAARSGIGVKEGLTFLPELWPVVTETLRRRHGVAPVHSLDEIAMLADRFPDNMRCIVALRQGRVIAGTLLFCTALTDHAQYIASSEEGNEVAALDAVFDYAITSSKQNGKRWFDFGISTESNGWTLNEGLYRFKVEFGGGGTVYEFYELTW